jgi:hypothetical protein
MAYVICTTADNDEQLFTRGACFILAMVLNELTEWDLIELCRRHDFDCHVLVRHPNGLYLDIRGYQTEEQLREEWGSAIKLKVINSNELSDWDNPMDNARSYNRAWEIAQDLIEGTYDQNQCL